MSRISLVLGIIASLVIHAAIVLPSLGRKSNHADAVAVVQEERGTISVAQIPRSPAAPPAKPQPELPAPPPPQLKDVARPNADTTGEMNAGDLAENVSDDALPTLTILWSGPEELRAVCKSLGLRVVAVTVKQEVVGEVALDGEIRLNKFTGDFRQYCNRVRTLSPAFFGQALSEKSETRFSALWVLVPPDVDKRFCDLQREAIRRQGVPASRVSSVEARFEVDSSRHGYALVITRVVFS